MKIIRTVSEMQVHADQLRMEGRTLALVPTMGGLHEGHLSLMQRAKAEADHVTVSIFVNPTQFGPNEDFETYPRNFQRDCELIEEIGGVDIVFAPNEATLYPEGPEHQRVWITCPDMSKQLCGKYREGHFDGVLTVVMKLFAACKPHIGVFGLKDIQQYILLRQMIQDLSLDIKMIGGETVRESNGLAYSSRNEYLTADERSRASIIPKAINLAVQMIEDEKKSPEAVTGLIQKMIQSVPQAELQYAEVVTASKLEPVERFIPGMQVIVAVAVYFRHIRLIDNAFALVPA